MPMLGVELFRRLMEVTGCRDYCGMWVNPKTMGPIVQKIFRWETGIMDHYYRLNSGVKEYKIAKIVDKRIAEVKKDGAIRFVRITELDELEGRFSFERRYPRLPYKDKTYLDKRYLKHPIYQYQILGVEADGEIRGLLMAREVKYNGERYYV